MCADISRSNAAHEASNAADESPIASREVGVVFFRSEKNCSTWNFLNRLRVNLPRIQGAAVDRAAGRARLEIARGHHASSDIFAAASCEDVAALNQSRSALLRASYKMFTSRSRDVARASVRVSRCSDLPFNFEGSCRTVTGFRW